MNVLPEASGRIKVILSIEDVDKLGISVEDIDCSNPDTRLLLRALFKTAAERIGINCDSEKLLIEAYPHIGGGGVLYFTPLDNKEKEYLKIKSSVNTYTYEFSDGTNLLNTIKFFYNNDLTKNIISYLYEINKKFYLIIENAPKSCNEIFIAKELCDNFYKNKNIKKYACEHGKALSGNNAISEIGENL